MREALIAIFPLTTCPGTVKTSRLNKDLMRCALAYPIRLDYGLSKPSHLHKGPGDQLSKWLSWLALPDRMLFFCPSILQSDVRVCTYAAYSLFILSIATLGLINSHKPADALRVKNAEVFPLIST